MGGGRLSPRGAGPMLLPSGVLGMGSNGGARPGLGRRASLGAIAYDPRRPGEERPFAQAVRIAGEPPWARS